MSGIGAPRPRNWRRVALAAALLALAAGALALWVLSPATLQLASEATDPLEGVMDRRIVEAVGDFAMWNRLNIAVQGTAILLGLLATLLTALTTPGNTERLKVATVSVTAVTAALIGVQSTFHLRENLHTEAAALTNLLTLEADYTFARDRIAEAKGDASGLRHEMARKLIRIRSQRMLSLAAIGDSAPAAPTTPPPREAPAFGPRE